MSADLPLARMLTTSASRGRLGVALLLALLGHAAVVVLAAKAGTRAPRLVAVTEVELAPAPAASPPAPPVAPPEPQVPPAPQPAPATAARPQKRAAASRPAAAPAAGRAAAVRTVDEDAPTPEGPVRFVSDATGAAFGSGAVARGGTADVGQQPAAPVPARAPRGPSAAPSLSRPPRLGEADPCRGFFPQRARVDRGEVTLRVRVERDGSVRSIAISSELPLGHGFGFAARDCLRAKRFTPALDLGGREVAVLAPVTVRFSR